jgi:hypothetical protein
VVDRRTSALHGESTRRCGCEAAGRASIASRFGEITPAFAAAFGARVDVGLLLGARNAQARTFTICARSGRRAASGSVLPVEILATQALPPSRVCMRSSPARPGSR